MKKQLPICLTFSSSTIRDQTQLQSPDPELSKSSESRIYCKRPEIPIFLRYRVRKSLQRPRQSKSRSLSDVQFQNFSKGPNSLSFSEQYPLILSKSRRSRSLSERYTNIFAKVRKYRTSTSRIQYEHFRRKPGDTELQRAEYEHFRESLEIPIFSRLISRHLGKGKLELLRDGLELLLLSNELVLQPVNLQTTQP